MTSFHTDLSEWVEFTDGGISEWTCGGGGQVITTWSHSSFANGGGYVWSVAIAHLCRQAHIQVARQGDWVGCDFLF